MQNESKSQFAESSGLNIICLTSDLRALFLTCMLRRYNMQMLRWISHCQGFQCVSVLQSVLLVSV